MSLPAATTADNSTPSALFSIRGRAEPGLLPRLIELFAKRGLVPSRWQSALSGPGHSELTIDIEMPGLGREVADYIAQCMRQMASVEVVLTSEVEPAAAFG